MTVKKIADRQLLDFAIENEPIVEGFNIPTMRVDQVRLTIENGELTGLHAFGLAVNANGQVGKRGASVMWVEARDCPEFILNILRITGVWFREDDDL